MPYLRLYSLELPREVKRTMVTELTQAVVDTRHLVGEERDALTIHFVPFDPEDLAIGGKLVANGRRPDFHIEYSDHGLNARAKGKLAKEITLTMSRVLDPASTAGVRINVLFRDYVAHDLAVGGALAAPRRPGRTGRALGLLRRLLGRIRLRRGKAARTVSTNPRTV